MELSSVNRLIQEGKVSKVEYEGMSMLNNMGYTEKLPRQVLLQEINTEINKMNLMLPDAKKLRLAELHKDGTIWVPQITLTKMKEGGYITNDDMWLSKYQNAGTVVNTNTVSIPPQAGGQTFVNYTNTATNPVSLTNAKFSCPGGTCNLPTGEIAPGQTVQIPITYTSANPGSLYLFNSAGAMQNYKIETTPETQIDNFKNTVTPTSTPTSAQQSQAAAKAAIEATKKVEQTGRMGELVKHQAGFYDASGKNWQFVNGKLVPASRFKYGGNTWLDKYQTGGPTTRYSYVLDDDNGNTVFDDNGNPIIINPTTNYTVPEWLPQVNITAPRIIPSSGSAGSAPQSNASLAADIVLDGMQFIPGPVGAAASAVGVGKNLYEGDYIGAGLDLANLVTLGGAKWLVLASDLANAAGKVNKAGRLARQSKILEHASNPNLWRTTGTVKDLAKVKTTDSNPEYKNEPKKAPNLLGKKNGGWLNNYK